jgi:hypothetical protein
MNQQMKPMEGEILHEPLWVVRGNTIPNTPPLLKFLRHAYYDTVYDTVNEMLCEVQDHDSSFSTRVRF